jgi:hypothetical protein
MILYGIGSPGPGSDIVGDVVEWFLVCAELVDGRLRPTVRFGQAPR